MIVELPHGLTGVLPITQVSDEFDQLLSEEQGSLHDSFHEGQIIRCAVHHIAEPTDKKAKIDKGQKENLKKRRLQLTLRPEVINEDLTIDSITRGLASISSFPLPFLFLLLQSHFLPSSILLEHPRPLFYSLFLIPRHHSLAHLRKSQEYRRSWLFGISWKQSHRFLAERQDRSIPHI
jgi:hypothetical protein